MALDKPPCLCYSYNMELNWNQIHINQRRAQKTWWHRNAMWMEVYSLGHYSPNDTLCEVSPDGSVTKTFREWFDEWGLPDPPNYQNE